MDSNYVFLCGVMWCAYGQEEAGKELLRATSSADPDVRSLAWALLERGIIELKNTVLGIPGVERLEDMHLDQAMPVM